MTARQQAPHCRVVSLRDHQKKLRRNGVKSTGKLKAGQVVTSEPGLYYRGIGGVRLADGVLVTTNGARNLTRFEKALEI